MILPDADGLESEDIPDWAVGVGRVVVFSGAGISTDSGIPDFRGPAGAWTLNPGLQARHTYQNFLAEPGLRASYWRSRAESPVWEAEPNAAHLAVASLSGSGIDVTVVTQNTDGLHQRAGTPAGRVVELHGTMHISECVGCRHQMATTEVLARVAAGEAAPGCSRCGGILKTASIMFGQTMSPGVFARALHAVTTCGLVLAVGTTLMIEPAGSLCASAVRAGARLVIVNRDPTPYDSIAAEVIRVPIGEALPRIVRHLQDGQTGSGAGPVPAVPGRAGTAGARAHAPSGLASNEAADLRHSAAGFGLELTAETAAGAAVTAMLCGAADKTGAMAVLGHIPKLQDQEIRSQAADWLRGLYPPAPASTAFWNESIPDETAGDLIAAVATPRFLLTILTETAPGQDQRALTVLARAAATRPPLRAVLTELLGLLPGLSPAAIDAALSGGHPEPLAEALARLARNAALPADLLDAIPVGTTVLGEFPVLLAESLAAAYEQRAQTPNGLRGLAKTLIELASRLADLGRASEAQAVAQRAVTTAGQLAEPRELSTRAAQALNRAAKLAHTQRRPGELPPGIRWCRAPGLPAATPLTTLAATPPASRAPHMPLVGRAYHHRAAAGGCGLRSGYACHEEAHTSGRGHRAPDPARRAGPRR